MTAQDEDILTSRALLKSGKAVSTLMRNCITDRTINVDELLAGDRNAILIGIRITGYGAEYKVQMVCPDCGEKVTKDVDLGSLPIKRFPENAQQVAIGKNEFTYTLPVSKRNVVFRLMTGAMEQELLQLLERTRKLHMPDELVTTRLKFQVLSVGNESDPAQLANVIRTMPARDSRDLRNYIDSVTPGIELKTTFECPACGYLGEGVEVPLGTEFFWPAAGK
jgi:predicted RNA-binding Zn-ribbon protein involved in translation (DUF1610 family)